MSNAAISLPLDLPSESVPYHKTIQRDINRCFFCGELEEPHRPFVAVLTWITWSARHFVHWGECHDKHSARCRAERDAARTVRTPAKPNLKGVEP